MTLRRIRKVNAMRQVNKSSRMRTRVGRDNVSAPRQSCDGPQQQLWWTERTYRGNIAQRQSNRTGSCADSCEAFRNHARRHRLTVIVPHALADEAKPIDACRPYNRRSIEHKQVELDAGLSSIDQSPFHDNWIERLYRRQVAVWGFPCRC